MGAEELAKGAVSTSYILYVGLTFLDSQSLNLALRNTLESPYI